MSRPTRTDAPPPEPRPSASALKAPPLREPLGPFTVDGDIYIWPQKPGQPYIVLGRELAWKIYRLADLERLGTLARVRREADVALEVNSVDGVLGAMGVGEHDGWLVIEMRRMHQTLGDHLVARAADPAQRMSPEEYVHLLAGVGETLGRLHRRGIVHRDIKPANLLFDGQRTRLYVCDFSVVRTRRSEMTRTGVTLGTDSYIAPEQWRLGESTPASDQYSLGIVARETLEGHHAPPTPRPLADVLRTATSADPEDRYPGVDGARAFGDGLRRAAVAEPPRTLTDRLRDASEATRFSWAPAALAFLGVWIWSILRRDPDIIVGLETILPPALAAALAFTCCRLLNLPRGRRSRSGWSLLDQWWSPWLVVGVYLIALDGRVEGWTALPILAIPLAFAYAGAYPPRCGHWLPNRLDAVTRAIRTRPALGPLRLGKVRAALGLAALAVITYAPVVSGRVAPAAWTGPTGVDSQALLAVREFRKALAKNDVDRGCSMMDGTVTALAPCAMWMRLQIRLYHENVTRSRGAAHGKEIFDDVPSKAIELRQLTGTEAGGKGIYNLAVAGNRRTFGLIAVLANQTNVIVDNGAATTPVDAERRASEHYEVRYEPSSGFWKIHYPQECTGGGRTIEGRSAEKCISAMRVKSGAINAYLAEP